MKNPKMVKSLIIGALVVTFSLNAFAQNPDANFLPKDPKTDNLLTGDNAVLLVIDWQQDLINVVQNID